MTKRAPFRYFKTSPEIIRLAVMLYVRFPLSLRNVEDLLHERGIDAGITRFATVAKYNARTSRPRLCGAAVLGNAQSVDAENYRPGSFDACCIGYCIHAAGDMAF